MREQKKIHAKLYEEFYLQEKSLSNLRDAFDKFSGGYLQKKKEKDSKRKKKKKSPEK